jgi:hypothetical protein
MQPRKLNTPTEIRLFKEKIIRSNMKKRNISIKSLMLFLED